MLTTEGPSPELFDILDYNIHMSLLLALLEGIHGNLNPNHLKGQENFCLLYY